MDSARVFPAVPKHVVTYLLVTSRRRRWGRTLVSPGAEGCLESRVYGAGGRRVEPAANGCSQVVGGAERTCRMGLRRRAADAANGSWAGTKQSDADRPMWAHVQMQPNRIFWVRDVSGRRDEYPERSARAVHRKSPQPFRQQRT